MKLTKRVMIVPVASLLLLGGCVKPSAYKDPISKFQTATVVVTEGTRNEYYAVNKRERDALIDRHIAEGKKIDLLLLNETRLIEDNDFSARMDALYALKKHGELLFKLANSAAPEEAKQAVNSLDDALLKLSSSLKQAPSSDFKTKAGAFATIASEVTNLVLNAKVEEALKKAILLSEKDVSSLIALLKDDMAAIRARQKSTLSQARVLATDEYNQELKKTDKEGKPAYDPNKLKAAAEKIKEAEDVWENLAFLPGPGFKEMNDAHQKLVSYAKKDRKSPEDLAELVAAMEAFSEQAKIIADAIKNIQQ